MFDCPHCSRPIEIARKEAVPWWRYDRGGPTVGLGCGTLIIIALIVAIFSGGDQEEILREMEALDEKIDRIEASIEKLMAAEGPAEE